MKSIFSSRNFAVIIAVVVCHVLGKSSVETQKTVTQFQEYLMNLERVESNNSHNTTHNNRQESASFSDDDEGSAQHSVDDDSLHAADSLDGSTADQQAEDAVNGPLNGQTSNELLAYFRDVPRRHWSCCMLGLLAGNKGFQCRSEFYSQRLSLRNFNRPQSGLISGRINDRTKAYEITRTFRRCVTHKGQEFHKCCHVAATEQKELKAAKTYRKHNQLTKIRR